ncbi:kinesin-like protein [Hibiscus syriacus]|uniref:Kinesin-like protein n=1 Tax=Hibiscus syriacus TaxID=106335 RepID=A0A6A2XMT0_HIBSY|nr:kinesin-like protein [Hibiscus syriacus]
MITNEKSLFLRTSPGNSLTEFSLSIRCSFCVFGPSARQKDLYEQAVVPIVNEVLEGFNCTIFAYGQTGTGKTYTIEGECKRAKTGANGELPAGAGVIPRAVQQIFDTLEGQNAEYSVKKRQLPLMEDGKGAVLVRGLEEEIVTSASEIFTLLERGSAKRRTAETAQKIYLALVLGIYAFLVYLGRAREAGEINKSLLTLGRVINAIVEHLGHIPYRAKNIKNKPEVNQKMMKSTLIKDLYGEIERLKSEVYAAREKKSVYIPKERYYQEESERKAMTEQIEQMGVLLETHQKQLQELQDKYVAQVQQCSDLSGKLEMTEKNLNETVKLLANSEEELKKCHYVLNEKEFIICELKKAENALAHQACVLKSNLEKALKDNDSLSLKAILEMKKKVTAARALHVSHMEAVQNVVRLHKASSNAALEKISSLASSNAHSIEEFFSSEASKAVSMFSDLQNSLATHQGEMTVFVKELRQRFHVSIEQTNDISDYASEILDKLSEESVRVQNHAVQADEVQMKSISSFQKAYEEQLKSDAEKLIADMTNLVYNHVRRKKELVDARLVVIKESAVVNKSFLDGHVSSMESITTDAKRKWQAFAMEVENNAKDTTDFSAAKHCRIEELLQHCVSTAESAFKHYKSTQGSVNEMGSKHVSDMVSLIRNDTDSNEQHDAEIDSARVAAEQDGLKKTDDTLQYIDGKSLSSRI